MQFFEISSKEQLDALGKEYAVFKHGCILALGFFDGIHIAHRDLVHRARIEANEKSIPLVIFTFSAKSSSLKVGSPRLLTDKEKFFEFSELLADVVVSFDFELIKNIDAKTFITEILVNKLNTHTAFCGFNFRFGKNAEGNTALLEEKMKSLGRSTVTVPEFKENGILVSSSLIRDLLLDKKLRCAAKLLGKPFFADGLVSHGLGLGKKLGFPTVNLDLDKEKLALPSGVYFTAVKWNGSIYPAITNFGICPTFDEREIHSETFIFNFEGNLYGENIRLYFIEFIRDEIKFSSQNELITQINVDKNKALKLMEEIKWQEIGLS